MVEPPVTAGPEHDGRGEGAVRLRAVSHGGILTDLTVDIARGERVVLLGRNGVGKTTLLRIIGGLLRPDRGSVDVGPRPGYVPQNYRMCLFPWFRVRKNLGLAAPAGTPPPAVAREVDAALATVPLGAELLERFPNSLSGGEQQLVVLARALVGGPTLVLLDEPFSALDAPARLRLRSTLRDRLTGTTLLFVSHDLDDAVALADRALVLDGRPARLVADVALGGRSPDDNRAQLGALLGAMS